MIACSLNLRPHANFLEKLPSLEAVTVMVNSGQLYVIVVYRRPQLPLGRFLSMFKDYLRQIPHSGRPTIILGDFNDNQLPSSPVSPLLGYLAFLS